MDIRVYQQGDAFREAVFSFLVAYEAMNCLPIGLMNSLALYDEPPYLAVVEEAGAPIAASIRTPPHNLVLSAVQGDPAPPTEALAERLSASGVSLPGVIGPRDAARCFAAAWSGRTGAHPTISVEERVYELKTVEAVAPVGGRMRGAQASDLPLIREWCAAFAREAMPEVTDPDAAAARTVAGRFPDEAGARGLRLWETPSGRPVALAGFGGPTPHGVRVGPVYTPPAERGHGYATALVAELSQELLDIGRDAVYLFTDLANPTSNRIYQRIGYRPVGDVDQYVFR